MNKVILLGNLCRDIELRYTKSQKAVMQNVIAVRNDRKGRTRVKIKIKDDGGKNFIDKRIYVWKKYNPDDDLKGYVIIHLNNDPLDFDIDNLAKVKKEVFLLMLNNNMYFNNAELNKTSVLIAENMYKAKKIRR